MDDPPNLRTTWLKNLDCRAWTKTVSRLGEEQMEWILLQGDEPNQGVLLAVTCTIERSCGLTHVANHPLFVHYP
jgi:hypothetical protein